MVRILSDSTCDLSPELIERYDIKIIPLYVRLGDAEYRDGIDITPEDLYKWSDENDATPKTAAPGISFFTSFINDPGDEYIIFTISSSMSSSFNNARLAAEELNMTDRVFVIDSRSLSTGIGLQVLAACEMAEEGMSGKEIVDEISAIIPKVRASFVIDTLTYLYRGGRCSGLSALLGAALKLHPRIAVSNGEMHPEKKYRGSAKKYISDYVRDMEQDLLNARSERVFITHSGCDPETIGSVRDYLTELKHFDEILVTRAGSVISSHCGPGTLGVLFIAG
ncbi:MAG: DegV family protein [Lachnospiraceae bacterium]|nr:DegV family protein [Lachnospiraceae bacterium]